MRQELIDTYYTIVRSARSLDDLESILAQARTELTQREYGSLLARLLAALKEAG